MPKKKTIEKMSYEEAFEELQSIVEKMEGGDLPLKDSLALFERGQSLSVRCSELLEEAQLRLRQLTEDESGELIETDLKLGDL
jgi:exodeoxyribonuclease VII small subunit